MNIIYKEAFSLVKEIKKELPTQYVPPSAGTTPKYQMVLPHSIVKNTRGYIEKVVNQINGCYERGWYDGCAVMMRRLIETLIIECFEHYNIACKIQNNNGDFFYLKDLIKQLSSESVWNLGRNAKKAFPKLKDIGDQSAHSRRFIAHREDIEKLISDFRIVVQELVFLANLG